MTQQKNEEVGGKAAFHRSGLGKLTMYDMSMTN